MPGKRKERAQAEGGSSKRARVPAAGPASRGRGRGQGRGRGRTAAAPAAGAPAAAAPAAAANAVLAYPQIQTATAPSSELEPSGSIDAALTRHRLRGDEAETPLASAYVSVVATFATSQLRLLRADHLSSHREGGVPASEANEEGAACIDAMQHMCLTWASDPARPTAFDICSAHAAVVVGGGMLRTRAVRAGRTKFATPPGQVQCKLEDFVAALRTLSARDDLSAVAKAAWAAYNLLALHPFPDGKGRLSRAVGNMMLARHGVPFVVSLCASEAQRAAYRTALRDTHLSNDLRTWATVVCQCVQRGWDALEALWQTQRAQAQEAVAGASARGVRDAARSGCCVICLDDGPTSTLLCCGSAFHMRCLSRWLVSSGTCPTCRAPVTAEERPEPAPVPAPAPSVVPAELVVDDTTEDSETDDTTEDDPADGDDTTEDAPAAADNTTADDTTADESAEEDSAEEDDSVEADDTTEDDTTADESAEEDSAEEDDSVEADDTTEDDTTADESAEEDSAEEDDSAEDDI